jgi:glutamate dehydrogenase
VLPIFEQLGLDLVDHVPGEAGDDFAFSEVEDPNLPEMLPLLAEAFGAAWEGLVDRDELAALVVETHLAPRQVQLVRAASQYLRQAGLGASTSYVRGILSAHRDFVRHWVELFEQRFDPAAATSVGDTPANKLATYADAATTRDEFRVLDWYVGLLDAVTRTNYFRTDDSGNPSATIVLKLDPPRLPFPTDPAVRVETFVHHPDVEGLHIRYGAVARGGLRWSDRVEDYRDEVLALAKAQQVKNSLIVPAGAKGAFVVRKALAALSPDEAAEEVRRCYRLFVRGLLDVTDDVDAGGAPPPGVLARDAPDPYLVVAADKGTAAFSDLANEEAAAAGFWLDDAFASGGSSGFNHKDLGVTARGAWVAVRRHFTELGIDPERDEITVAGIGDMSGDVFGNGMLLSRTIRLVAAFDHRHIFIDPSPDPEASYAERARLAALPRSSWADYDPTLISPGGGVFPRSGRAVTLSAQARAVLGIDAEELSADELVQAVLKAPVDLLWNGGIGTYVRASHETDADAADRGNDRVRVSADGLRCRVVGEGGNLGLTQAARIEFSLAGGRVNADFIDNVAGVNTSDREVNLKILLRQVEQDGLIDRTERDRILLDECADEVVAEVLADSERQTLALSVAEAYGATVLDRHDQVIRNLEQHGLVRHREHLPEPEEIERRRAAGRGLTRPEIAVVLGHAKNLVHELLLEGDVPDDPGVADVLSGYFPSSLQRTYADQVLGHRLGREIIATRLANDLIDRVGPGFIYRIEDRTGASTDHAIRAVLVVKRLLGLDELWDGLAPYPVAPTVPLRQALERALEHNVAWLARRTSRLGTIDAEAAPFVPLVARLRDALVSRPVVTDGGVLEGSLAALADLGAPTELLTACGAVARMNTALALAAAAEDSGHDVVALEEAYARMGEALGLSWLYATVTITAADPHWVQLAKAALRDELSALTVALATDVVSEGGLERWTRSHRDALSRTAAAYAGLADGRDPDVSMLTVGVQILRDLCHSVGLVGEARRRPGRRGATG